MRRNKEDMKRMRHDVKCYLLQCNNDYHAAYDCMVKEYMMSGKPIPYWIKGMKDFKEESYRLGKELNRTEQMNRKDRNRQIEQDKKIERVMMIRLDEVKGMYNKYRKELNDNENVVLVDMVIMIGHEGQIDKEQVSETMIRLVDKIDRMSEHMMA